MDKAKGPASGTIAISVGAVAAGLLYAWFLSVNFAGAIGGEARLAQAYAALAALALLWLALLALGIIDRAVGGPSWTRRAGFVLLPVAAIATTFATDAPNDRLSQIAVVALPLLAGAYALLGRLPAGPAAKAQTAALMLMAALSTYAIKLFIS